MEFEKTLIPYRSMARVEVDIIKMIINTYILKNAFHHSIYQQIAYIDNENGMIFEI